MTSQVMVSWTVRAHAQCIDTDNNEGKRFMTGTQEVIAAHRAAGRYFVADGVRSFVREEGEGVPVVFLHGMWGSSFQYRKVLAEVAARGLRGIAWDLPGFGLADRPVDYDYSWSGLGGFCAAAADALELDRFHLVVHDIGGPVGFELAATRARQVVSLTLLNTIVSATDFSPPWSMRPFRHRLIGEIWKAGLNRPLFRALMHLQGVRDRSSMSRPEMDAYLELMRGSDGGRAFLKVARSAERTAGKDALYRSVVSNPGYPVQVLWAKDDPAMKLGTYGEKAREAAGMKEIPALPGKHFFQEEQPRAIAETIARLASMAAPGSRP